MEIRELNIEKLETAAGMLKAISHPMRIAILNHLDKTNRMTVSEIHQALEIEQSTASHHLGILKDKGILGSKREGKMTYYFIKNQDFSKLLDCVSNCSCK